MNEIEATLEVTEAVGVEPELAATPLREEKPAGGKPGLAAAPDGESIQATHTDLGDYTLEVGAAPDGTRPQLLFCENEPNPPRIDGIQSPTPSPQRRTHDPQRGRAPPRDCAGRGGGPPRERGHRDHPSEGVGEVRVAV